MNSSAVSHELPLTFLSRGESGVVVRLGGPDEVRRKLAEQGIIPGAEVQLVQSDPGANVVVRIGETRLMLDRSAAGRVFIRTGER